MGISASNIILIVIAVLIGVPAAIALVVFVFVPVAKGIVWLVVHIAKFIGSEFADILRVLGAIIMMIVIAPLALANALLVRRSAAAHYFEAIKTEAAAAFAAIYRVLIGNPARLLMLTALTEGLEQRLPRVVMLAPTGDRPASRVGQFDGYTIVGSLPGGGSGSKLYIAKPSPQKLAGFSRAGITGVDQVVIKSFSLLDGSSLPQIVRENRALPAAKRLGLILEHEVHDDRFFYVTKFVPGETLGIVTSRMHAVSGGAGLDDQRLHEAIDYAADLARTLHYYHQNGLWHKDVKPDNLVISAGQAHLVDFGLITPLRSSITLTTHGTEYFRDPEMVRMALRGARVHEVDGCRFDIYAAGAVLFSMIENSFPAHGGLSRITKRCPESLRWIVRRAMADYDKRYASASDLLTDIEAVQAATDPFALRPADLPSVKSAPAPARALEMLGPEQTEVGGPSIGSNIPRDRGDQAATMPAAGATSVAEIAAAFASPDLRPPHPTLSVTSWWSGRYTLDAPYLEWLRNTHAERVAGSASAVLGADAAVQLSRARHAARGARQEAAERLEKFRQGGRGTKIAAIVFVSVLAFGLAVLILSAVTNSDSAGSRSRPPDETSAAQSANQTSPAPGPAVSAGELVEARPVREFTSPKPAATAPGTTSPATPNQPK